MDRGDKDIAHAFWCALLPGLPGGASEDERQELKFLQLNLGRGRDAQDLLMQTARETGADVLLISEQYIWTENSAWFQDASRRASILVCCIDLSIGDFLESDAVFVWVEVVGVKCTAATSLPAIPSRSLRHRSSFLR